MVINAVPGVLHGSESGMHPSTISPNIFYTERESILIKLKVFEGFGGVIKMHNPVNRAPYSYHGE